MVNRSFTSRVDEEVGIMDLSASHVDLGGSNPSQDCYYIFIAFAVCGQSLKCAKYWTFGYMDAQEQVQFFRAVLELRGEGVTWERIK